MSVTPTQSEDSDQANTQPNEITPSILQECNICGKKFGRMQERNRHLASYLPHSILCPFQGCPWTGRRQSDFKGHLKKKHPDSDQVPMVHAIELYDRREFVKKILGGTPVDEVARSAFTKVYENSEKLVAAGKVGANVLGRSRDLRMWIHNPSAVTSTSLSD